MKPEDWFCYGVFWIVLIAFAAWWVLARLGYDKRWFVVPAAPLISRNFYFALPTVVLGTTVLLAGMLLETLYPYLDTSFLPCIAVVILVTGYIPAYFEPDWMSPAWYRWLKKEHGDILEDLSREAERLGRKEWLKRVQTQEDLERWVEEYRRSRPHLKRLKK